MPDHPIRAALMSGARAELYAERISSLCATLPADTGSITADQRSAILILAIGSRSTEAVRAALGISDANAADSLPDFDDLFCDLYYPVIEAGSRAVAFWSVKDSAILPPANVHEWVRGFKIDKKTGQRVAAAVPFGTHWTTKKPDYTLYGVAADRAEWRKRLITDENGRQCVNILFGTPPVRDKAPARYCDAATGLLDLILTKSIHDGDAANAERKRRSFVLDAGAHLLALRDGGGFRCKKLFCFTSTNAGQGTGKSLLQESIAALVPKDASCTVPTTTLGSGNLLPLYSSSVCILTEAPSTSTERYTAEDIKSFADAGWKTAEEKYVAKRSVRDNSLKLLSSNHLAPLPIDNARSRRVEFFVAEENDDNGMSVKRVIDAVQASTGWTDEELRECIGWALLLRAKSMLDAGFRPVSVARRSHDPRHLLSVSDYDFFVANKGNVTASYSEYCDFRSDAGFTWNPNKYVFESYNALSKSCEVWLDEEDATPDPPPVTPTKQDAAPQPEEPPAVEPTEEPSCETVTTESRLALQYKARMIDGELRPGTLTIPRIYALVVGDERLKRATAGVRAGTLEKKRVLEQVFPSVRFKGRKFGRDDVASYTGLVHVDFDHISEKRQDVTPSEVRDALATLPGFVIGALSSRGNGAWAIFNAGDQVEDYDTFQQATRVITDMAIDLLCMDADEQTAIPTTGRTVAHDPECRISDDALIGGLPEPFPWKASKYRAASALAERHIPNCCKSPADIVADERFMEAVVDNACTKIHECVEGERHATAIKQVANVWLCCEERGIRPLSSWGRRLRDACLTCGLERGETASIMGYWRNRTGLSV